MTLAYKLALEDVEKKMEQAVTLERQRVCKKYIQFFLDYLQKNKTASDEKGNVYMSINKKSFEEALRTYKPT